MKERVAELNYATSISISPLYFRSLYWLYRPIQVCSVSCDGLAGNRQTLFVASLTLIVSRICSYAICYPACCCLADRVVIQDLR